MIYQHASRKQLEQIDELFRDHFVQQVLDARGHAQYTRNALGKPATIPGLQNVQDIRFLYAGKRRVVVVDEEV
jgi:hypothetical protein